MANKTVVYAEPTEAGIERVFLAYNAGSLVSVEVTAVVNGDDSSTLMIDTHADASDLSPGQVTSLEQVLGKVIDRVLIAGGFS